MTPNTVTPAPWVPFTRQGCNVGDVSTANQELENNSYRLPQGVRRLTSPRSRQLNGDPDLFKDAEVADYDGVAVHCASGNAFCASAQGVKFGQTAAVRDRRRPDTLPSEPGGYNGFQALYGHRYVAPQLGAGTANVSHNGFAGHQRGGEPGRRENGNQINGAFCPTAPGFPGFGSINASQTLAYLADMLEVGRAGGERLHGRRPRPESGMASPGVTGRGVQQRPAALGSGSACYVAQAQYYNQAFGTFFQRLAADGITPANTLFVLSSDEGDHDAGANVGRAIQPTRPPATAQPSLRQHRDPGRAVHLPRGLPSASCPAT